MLILFHKLNFPENWHFFIFTQFKTQLSISQTNFLVTETYCIWQLPNYENLKSPKMTHPTVYTVYVRTTQVLLYVPPSSRTYTVEESPPGNNSLRKYMIIFPSENTGVQQHKEWRKYVQHARVSYSMYTNICKEYIFTIKKKNCSVKNKLFIKQ